jgi:hypothetical protein
VASALAVCPLTLLLIAIALNVFVPRRINRRTGMFVREWWRLREGGRRGDGGSGFGSGGFYG